MHTSATHTLKFRTNLWNEQCLCVSEMQHGTVVTLEFGAERTTLLSQKGNKIEVQEWYKPFLYKFKSIILCSYPYGWQFHRIWGLKIKTTAQNSSQNPSRCFAVRRWTWNLIGQQAFECTSLAFVICTYSEKDGSEIILLFLKTVKRNILISNINLGLIQSIWIFLNV